MSSQIAEDSATVVLPPETGGLHKPWRALVAVAELLGAAAAVLAALWCWPRGVVTITLALEDGSQLVSTRYFGQWMAAAIALGTVAALLVLDAVRQTVLAVRANPRRRSRHAASAASGASGVSS